MSGILGIWNLDGRPLEPELLSKMSATLTHRGPDGEGLWIDGPVGLACQLMRVTPESLTETQPLVSPSGAVAVFDGRLDNREDLLGLLKGAWGVEPDSPDPALVLALYDKYGDRFPEYLNGDFALAVYDLRRQQLLLARDAIGVRPLYYHRVGDTFLFASEIKAILAHPQVSTRPNDDFLAHFLINNTIASKLHGSTLFEEVFGLLPGHMAILTSRRLICHQYWDFDPERRVRLASFAQYAEAFRSHFEEAVRRRLRSFYPVAVSVSGGLDSSAIFCQAESLRRRAPGSFPTLLGLAYTSTDGSPADESEFIIEIERAYDLAITRQPLGPGGCLKWGREAIWHLEAPILAEDLNQSFLRNTRQLGARMLLTGHWGDQFLFEQAYLVDLVRNLAWGQAWVHLKKFPRWFTDANPRYFRQRFLKDLVKNLTPALIPWLRQLQTSLCPGFSNQLWFTEAMQARARSGRVPNNFVKGHHRSSYAESLYYEAKVGYNTLDLETNNKLATSHGIDMAFPFLDRDLIAFLMAIPGEMASWQGVPKGILREAMRGVLPEAIARRNSKGDLTEYANEGMERDFTQLVHILQSGGMAISWGYLRRDLIEAKLPSMRNQIQRGDCLVTWSLADLLGLELWLQTFLPAGAPSPKQF